MVPLEPGVSTLAVGVLSLCPPQAPTHSSSGRDFWPAALGPCGVPWAPSGEVREGSVALDLRACTPDLWVPFLAGSWEVHGSAPGLGESRGCWNSEALCHNWPKKLA